ncbi:hypothetical protein [Sphingomonas edaphi]|uniref:Spore coat protein U domain-containing protein n=1 Tax=Sphingomonas edaphi TaxID=2315689 RepID=A0A418PYB7_9SPHN|nr:hypothetical protein [Sphingomonas edaphi]RIX27033.1 hypothetical protein D3M59_10785 [Sphingomonas edaphi]
MKLAHLLLLATAAAIPTAASAAAKDCRVLPTRIDPTPITVNYDPFEVAPVNEAFNVEVRTEDCPDPRNIFLEVSSDDPTAIDGRTVSARGPGGQIVRAILSDRTTSNGRDKFFNVKLGIQEFYVLIDRGQVVPPGVYRAPLIAKTVLNQGNNTPEALTSFELVIVVGAAVGLAPASSMEISLGTLENNDTAMAPASFDAYANIDYELEILSDNGFRLVRDGLPGQAAVAFVPVLDAQLLPPFSARATFARPLGADSRRRHQLNAKVPSIAGAPAGDYEDVVTVQISAKLGG